MQILQEVEIVPIAADMVVHGWLLGEPPVAYGANSPKLLERVRLALRARHYSRRTEATYVNWVRRLGKQGRHHQDESILQKAFKRAVGEAGLTKRATCHALRNAST